MNVKAIERKSVSELTLEDEAAAVPPATSDEDVGRASRVGELEMLEKQLELGVLKERFIVYGIEGTRKTRGWATRIDFDLEKIPPGTDRGAVLAWVLVTRRIPCTDMRS